VWRTERSVPCVKRRTGRTTIEMGSARHAPRWAHARRRGCLSLGRACDAHRAATTGCAGPGRSREVDGRGHSAHRPRPVWLAPWGESPVKEGRCETSLLEQRPRGNGFRHPCGRQVCSSSSLPWVTAAARTSQLGRFRPPRWSIARDALGCASGLDGARTVLAGRPMPSSMVCDLVLHGHGSACSSSIGKEAKWASLLG
jgi:hypothetical protein